MSTETEKPPTHHVTIDYTDGYASLSLACSAPDDAPCRAEWHCDCEEFSWSGTGGDGMPVHTVWDEATDGEVEHCGTWGGACSLKDWFAEEREEAMRGKVTVPVKAQWGDDGYEFVIAEATTEGTAS